MTYSVSDGERSGIDVARLAPQQRGLARTRPLPLPGPVGPDGRPVARKAGPVGAAVLRSSRG